MGKVIEVKGDLLNMNMDFICNENNTLGIMGGGIALQIAKKFPNVKSADEWHCYMYKDYPKWHRNSLLGKSILYDTNEHEDDNRCVVNMYAQTEVGTEKRQLNYFAFACCLKGFADWLREEEPSDVKVGFPKYIGCGLAGGEWKFVEAMLYEFAESVPQDIYIVEFEK